MICGGVGGEGIVLVNMGFYLVIVLDIFENVI